MIHLFSQRDASLLDWKSTGAEYIMESTGKMTTREKASVHIKAGGAKRVIISAPSKDVPNLVYGVNHGCYVKDQDIISNASCTVSGPAALSLQELIQDQLPRPDRFGSVQIIRYRDGDDDDRTRVHRESKSSGWIQRKRHPIRSIRYGQHHSCIDWCGSSSGQSPSRAQGQVPR